ncbi:TolC family protein [uncultured Hymenobacter sp.]|uniref:TolC family protein n=1 Tax=uncultured Hymenobacter sp. TaxID=170016 RepID=UPI0035CA6A39
MRFLLPLLFLSLPPCLAQTPATAPARPPQLEKPATVEAAPPLTLQEATQLALNQNFGIRLARQDEQLATNNFTRGNAGQLPSLTGNATRTFNRNNINQRFGDSDPRVVNGGTSNLLNSNVTLGWTIFDGFAMFIAYDQLRTLRQQQQAISRATVEETVEDVSNAYFAVVREAGKIRSLEEALAIGQARVDLTQARVDVGVAAKVEVLTARVDYNADRSLLLQQQELLRTAKIQLNALLGRAPGTDFSPADSIVVARNLAREPLQAQLTAANPRLQQARLGVAVATYDRRLARANRYPSLGVVAGYGLNRNINNAAFAGTALTNSSNRTLGLNYGLTASLPIFDGFNLRRLEQNARVAEESSQLQLQQTTLQLDADLEQAYQRYQNRLRLLELEEDNIRLARQNVQIALERYRLGLLTPLALHEAQRSQLDAAVRLLDIRYQAKEAETALRRLSGSLVQAQ